MTAWPRSPWKVNKFVEFAFKILRTGHAFYRSENGVPGSGLELEAVYQDLKVISGTLCSTVYDSISKDEKAIATLGADCQTDCDHLLQILQSLRSSGSKRKSFQFAVKYVWKGKQEIEALLARLRDKHQALDLHISAITNKTVQRLDIDLQRLSQLSAKNEAHHKTRLDEIDRSLQEIKHTLSSAPGACRLISSSDVKSLTSKLSDLSESEESIAKEQAILSSLDFERRTARYESISEAHKKTFDWVFDDAKRKALGAEKFFEWIKTSGEVFWISGKPGSGKSTFIKFLADHEQILKAASVWSAPDDVLIASHYFWNAGGSMQNSQAGFFQGVLYDILRQKPNITRHVCSDRWRFYTLQSHQRGWGLKELQQSFDYLSGTRSSVGLKILLFVDGLDEYEGDHIDLCRFIKELAGKSSNIKICAASRPWNAFEESFGWNIQHRIKIHELTYNDNRLDSLPSDLESLYRHLLLSVDPHYHQKTAEILLLRSDLTGDPDWEVFSLHERSYTDTRYVHRITPLTLTEGESDLEQKALTRHIMGRCRGLLEVDSYWVEWIHRTANDFTKTAEMQDHLKRKCRPSFHAAIAEMHARIACFIRSSGSRPLSETMVLGYVMSMNRRWLPIFSTVTQRIWHDSGVFIHDPFKEEELLEVLDHIHTSLLSSTECITITSELDLTQKIPASSPPDWQNHGSIQPIDSGFVPDLILSLGLWRYALRKLELQPDYFKHSICPALQFVLRHSLEAEDTYGTNLLHQLLDKGYNLNQKYLKIHEAVAFGHINDESHPDLEMPSFHDSKTPWISCIESLQLSLSYSETRRVEKMMHRHKWATLCPLTETDDEHSGSDFAVKTHYLLHYLKSGVLAMLLRYGADPNAQSTPFTTAWTSFVCAGLTEPMLLQVEDAYLETLDEFLHNAADLGATTIGLALDPGNTRTRLPWKLVTGWDMFCEHLEHLTPKYGDARMISFIGKITSRMIEYAIETNWPFGRLPEILAEVFPEHMHVPMMQLMERHPAKQLENSWVASFASWFLAK
ncbi:hypothetical protein BJ166DRAFT_578110 [Pestalotiopsis sp. NC0098]|nr:hypothetical protein BJ166DRAFT_578110 [Pestalotiopsis sp. NC0098]